MEVLPSWIEKVFLRNGSKSSSEQGRELPSVVLLSLHQFS
jgi:hypothetical protein